MNSDSDDNSEDVDGDDRDAVMDSSKETKCRDQADDDSKEEQHDGKIKDIVIEKIEVIFVDCLTDHTTN